MHFMNPQGAFALFAVLTILVLYILKQRMEPRTVSSTYLWKKALARMEADRPFQKLRRNLLLFMQLLTALLLTLSLLRPMTLSDGGGEMLFVFDLSASMQAETGGETRIERAVADARRRVDGLPDGARVSILTAGADAEQPLARSADRVEIRRALADIKAQNGGADLDGALSLAQALQKELEDALLIVYTDQRLPEGAYTQPFIGDGAQNRALLSLNASGNTAVARVANYGGAAEVSIECYADGVLCDVRSVSVPPGGVESVQFDVPEGFFALEARIAETDALPGDNARHFAAREESRTTVLLAGRDNIFLEKALSLRPDITVLKTTPEEASLVAGGALTVLDGPLPEALPEKGALFLIDPDQLVGGLVTTPATLSAATGALAEEINRYLKVDDVQVAQYRAVEGGTPIWLADGQPVLSLLERGGQRMAVLGFDLHHSNLPLLKEFPLFIQHLLEKLAPEPLGADTGDLDCGAKRLITPQSFAVEASVITPSGRRVALPLTGALFTDTDEIGVYRLAQTGEDGSERSIPFTLHIPAAESDVREVFQKMQEAEQAGGGTEYGREWTPYVIALLLIALLLEWWVYRRGY